MGEIRYIMQFYIEVNIFNLLGSAGYARLGIQFSLNDFINDMLGVAIINQYLGNSIELRISTFRGGTDLYGSGN